MTPCILHLPYIGAVFQVCYLICKDKGQNTACEGTRIETEKTAEEETQSKVVLVVL